MKETQKDKIIRLRNDGYLPIQIARMINGNINSVHSILSRHRPQRKDLKREAQIVKENITLQIVNGIFNNNPVIRNENRMAAY